MDVWYTVLAIFHVIVCFFLITVVLLQQGKGAGMGVAFGGGGGSSSVFGARGAGSFLGKLTAVGATIFMLNSMVLAYMSSSSRGLFESDSSRTTERDDAERAALPADASIGDADASDDAGQRADGSIDGALRDQDAAALDGQVVMEGDGAAPTAEGAESSEAETEPTETEPTEAAPPRPQKAGQEARPAPQPSPAPTIAPAPAPASEDSAAEPAAAPSPPPAKAPPPSPPASGNGESTE